MAAFVSFRSRRIFLTQGKKEAFSENKTLCQILQQALWGVLHDLERPRCISEPGRWCGLRRHSSSAQLWVPAPTLPRRASTPRAAGCPLRGRSILFSSSPLHSLSPPALNISGSPGLTSLPSYSPTLQVREANLNSLLSPTTLPINQPGSSWLTDIRASLLGREHAASRELTSTICPCEI